MSASTCRRKVAALRISIIGRDVAVMGSVWNEILLSEDKNYSDDTLLLVSAHLLMFPTCRLILIHPSAEAGVNVSVPNLIIRCAVRFYIRG